jgi:hypothetical protein
MVLVLMHVVVLAPAFAAKTKVPQGTAFPMKYEGGSVQMRQHDILKVYVSPQTITMVQGKSVTEVPTSAVTEISYGSDVHRRVGPAIGVAAVTFGIGAMMLLVKTKKHYVGLVWNEPGTDRKGGVMFKVGKGDYRGFITALEGVTGKTAVDTDAVDKKK